MTALKLMNFQQCRICCSDLSVTTDKISSEFEQEFMERFFPFERTKNAQ